MTSTRETFPPKQSPAFRLQTVKQITDTSAVAAVQIGPVAIGGIWVNDIQGEPEVAWPRSTRGFSLATVTDEALRNEIEAAIVGVVKRWGDYREGQGAA